MLKIKFICKICVQLLYRHALLFHGIAETHGYGMVLFRIKIIGHAERRPDFILAAVAFADISTVIKFAVIFFRQLCKYLLRALVQLLDSGSTPIFTGASAG